MAELEDIRAAVAASLVTLNTTGLEMVDDEFVAVQVLPYSTGSPSLPAVLVTGIEEVDYKVAFRNEDLETIVRVQAFVGDSFDESAQRMLDKLLMGDNSVRALLSVDPTFGGTVQSSFVDVQSGHRVFDLANTKYLGAEWALRVVLTD